MKKQLKSFLLAILLALLTVIFCLVIADGILGTDGHMEGNRWSVKDRTGLIFFWVSMVLITSVFSFLVEWKRILVVIPVYFLLYFPVSMVFGESPQHTYLDKSTMALLTIGPDSEILRALLTAIRFWVAQSFIFLAFWPVKTVAKWFTKRRKDGAL